eukprot:14983245-Ditylum_brightwellii.AAC.1
MLPDLGIRISVPKALQYFRLCDKDDSGEIDYNEFKVALFACDNDDNPVGFAPSSLLTPKDAFQMFDKDKTGKIDEDEFSFLLEYLNIHLNDEKQEKMFRKYDRDDSGYIDYNEFKKVWVRVGNTKNELVARGVNIPKFATQAQLVRMLERILDGEEEQEALALAEAERWKKWQDMVRLRKQYLSKAKMRAEKELCSALDAAGQHIKFSTGGIWTIADFVG